MYYKYRIRRKSGGLFVWCRKLQNKVPSLSPPPPPKNRFEVSIYGKGNFELLLSTMKSHKRVFFGHIYPHRFIVYTIFIIFVPGFLALKSLEAVQAEVMLVIMVVIATSMVVIATQVLNHNIVLLLIIS